MSNQYRSILKATSIFGGTQVLQILITFVRSKFVALLIGAEGMGLSAMYNSTITLFVTICGLGIGTSVVRDLSKAYDDGDQERLATITGVFNRLLLYLSIVGVVLVVALAKPLSLWTFDTLDFQNDFRLLSLMLFFTLLQNGNTSLLIGNRRIKDTAISSLIVSFVTLATSVPLFYFFGTKGIAPGFVISSFAAYIVTWCYCRKLKIKKVAITFHEIKKYGRTIIVLGVAMVVSLLLGNLTRYLINIAISRIGDLTDLGYYNAATSITLQSISLVFAAMASDYFPRLSIAMKDRNLMNETVKQQTEVIIYMVVPILLLMMIAAPIIVRILLTEEFLIINDFIRIIVIGMFFKSMAYPLGYLAFAKGDKNIYFWLEGVYSNISTLIFSVILYKLWGLNGMAWAMVIAHILYYVLVSIVGKRRYGLVMDRGVLASVIGSTVVFIILYILSLWLSKIYYIVFASLVFVLILIFCLRQLERRTQMVSSIKKKIAYRIIYKDEKS